MGAAPTDAVGGAEGGFGQPIVGGFPASAALPGNYPPPRPLGQPGTTPSPSDFPTPPTHGGGSDGADDDDPDFAQLTKRFDALKRK